MPIMKQAIGVFVAPEKTPINPKPAKKGIDRCNKGAKELPNVAPISNNGVTSPP